MTGTDRRTFVYFVATEDMAMVKIGCSQVPEHRLSCLAAWSPQPLKVLTAVPGTYADEAALHGRYIALHSHREWFRSSPAMLRDISKIGRLGELPDDFRGHAGMKNPIWGKSPVRSSPEWRAKISEIHKARWAKEKRERAILRDALKFIADHRISIEEFNNQFGQTVVNQRKDGSHYLSTWAVSLDSIEKLLRETFLTGKAA
jgi:hypothetical protein